MSPSLKELGLQCARLFRTAVAARDGTARDELEELVGRYKIFAGGIGLFAPGRANIDYRFQSDEESRDALSNLLFILRIALKHVLPSEPIVTPEAQPNLPKEVHLEAPSQVLSTPGAEDCSSDESSLEEASTSSTEGDFAHPDIKVVEATIDKLYRFLVLVKNRRSSSKYSRVLRFSANNCVKTEDDDFESFVRFSIRREMELASATLTERFVNAAIYRRWKILYEQEHSRKLKQNIGDVLDPEGSTAETYFDQPSQTETEQKNTGKMPIVVDHSPPTQRRVRFAPMSDTEPSTLQNLESVMPLRSIAPSNVTPSGIVRRGKLDIPPAPKPDSGSLSEVVCPYCSSILGVEVVGPSQMNRMRWA